MSAALALAVLLAADPAPAPATAAPVALAATAARFLALRLRPGQDLRKSLEAVAKDEGLKAGFVVTTVGSLSRAVLRLADRSEPTAFEGKFEIVSLVGTLSAEGGLHLDASISDGTGRTIGGHLAEGCEVYTTAEVVLGEAQGLEFAREPDAQTGYRELVVRKAR